MESCTGMCSVMITARSNCEIASNAASFAKDAGTKIIEAFISSSSLASSMEL